MQETDQSFPGPLAARHVRRFFEDGFLVLPTVFARHELAEIRSAFERLAETARRLGETRDYRGARFVLDPAGAGVRIQRIVWCGAAELVLGDYGRDRRLIDAAAQLLGTPDLHQLINQAHFKLPGDGVEFPWHQDSTHRRYGQAEWKDVNGRGSYVQTVIAVDPVTETNGPLQFVRGSNRRGHIDTRPWGGRIPAELIDPERIVTPTLEPGDVVLFGPFTFHASSPNRSATPRRVLINGYAYPGANSRVYPGAGEGQPVSATWA